MLAMEPLPHRLFHSVAQVQAPRSPVPKPLSKQERKRAPNLSQNHKTNTKGMQTEHLKSASCIQIIKTQTLGMDEIQTLTWIFQQTSDPKKLECNIDLSLRHFSFKLSCEAQSSVGANSLPQPLHPLHPGHCLVACPIYNVHGHSSADMVCRNTGTPKHPDYFPFRRVKRFCAVMAV